LSPKNIAIIGAGLSGLTAAIRAAEQGHHIDLYEAAPELGGRTRSFFHKPTQSWVDHGPHLLIGAYTRTMQLLNDVDALKNTAWQASLQLPLWDEKRGFFGLKPSPYLPFPMALIAAVSSMPEHGPSMIPSLLRMAISMKKEPKGTVSEWMQAANIKPALQRDMLEVLCLGAMNEPMSSANAASFAHVLKQAFANHKTARLGWFRGPLSHMLIAPLQRRCEQLGITIHRSTRIVKLQTTEHGCIVNTRSNSKSYNKVILATAPSIRNKLLNIKQEIATQPICNIHLWFDKKTTLSSPFIGGIGTYGQWFFDISYQFQENNQKTTQLSHLCVVISADCSQKSNHEKLCQVLSELQRITGNSQLQAVHQRIISVQEATHLVRPAKPLSLPKHLIDACEQPSSGALPATIEAAIVRGEQAITQL